MAHALSPMMQQYQRLRASVPADTLLLFRLGDFYELFFEDAKIASGLLNLALTKRNEVPMCGMPYHAAQGYIAKLITAGHRVANHAFRFGRSTQDLRFGNGRGWPGTRSAQRREAYLNQGTARPPARVVNHRKAGETRP